MVLAALLPVWENEGAAHLWFGTLVAQVSGLSAPVAAHRGFVGGALCTWVAASPAALFGPLSLPARVRSSPAVGAFWASPPLALPTLSPGPASLARSVTGFVIPWGATLRCAKEHTRGGGMELGCSRQPLLHVLSEYVDMAAIVVGGFPE